MSALDNFFKRFRKKKPPPPPRREPLRLAEQVIRSDEAKDRITTAVSKHGPGTSLRWDKMLKMINTNEEPTEENYDPLRVEIDKEELKLVLRNLYDNKRSIASDGLALAREFIPLMYDKHSVERALNVSQRERDQRGITNECYAYGEIDHEIFAAMYLRLISVFGEKQNGIFYDLGCGVGTLVRKLYIYIAFRFSSCCFFTDTRCRFTRPHLLAILNVFLASKIFLHCWNEEKNAPRGLSAFSQVTLKKSGTQYSSG